MTVAEQTWIDPWWVEYRSYALRRLSATQWQMQHTAKSASEEAAFLKRQTSGGFASYYEELVAGLADWQDVEVSVGPHLEAHYQRLLEAPSP